jgi:hypothetical protein
MFRPILLTLALTVPPLALPAQTATPYRCGADASTSIATDRPQITNSSIVVPCGSLQFENGFQLTSASGQRTYDLPETAVRLGIARRSELRLTVPDYFRNPNGFGDLAVGFKQQLGPLHGFDLSVIPTLSLPSGANAISSHGYGPSIQFPWSRSLPHGWTLAGQLGLLDPTQSVRHNLTGEASLYIDRQLTAPWDAYVEYSGEYPQRGGPQHILDFGTAYKPTPHQQLDLHAGVGLSAEVADYSVGFGYSVRFQLLRPKPSTVNPIRQGKSD